MTPAPLALAVHLALAAIAAHAQNAPLTVLPEVKVTGAADNGYAVQSSLSATKTDTLLRDTPQAITVVGKELIQDQAMQGVADVIRYVPGVVTAQGEGNRDTAVFRGASSTGDFYVDGLRDDVQYYRDLYNIESVEVLKGANAMIFGRGGAGGVINRVSKQADWTPLRRASLTLGSWQNKRASIDLGQAAGSDLAWRLNAMAEDSGSYREGVDLRRHGINPTAAWRLGADTSLVLGYEYFSDKRTADRGVPSYQGRPLATDPGAFFGRADLSRVEADVNAFNAYLEHDFGGGLTVRNRTRWADYSKFYQNVFPGAVNAAGTTVALQGYNNATERRNLFNQTDFNYTLTAAGLQHKLAFGVELGRQVTDNFRNTAYFDGATSVNAPLSNPSTGAAIVFRQSASDADNHGTASTRSAYVQDQIVFSPNWQAIVGLRYDRFGVDFFNRRNGSTLNVTDTPLSPRAGLVYKPQDSVSLYASYSVAYVPRAGDQLSSLTATNAAFDPEQFRNLEVGAKWDVSPDLSASAAVYRLKRSNVVITDPADSTRSLLVDGQRTDGLEVGLQGRVRAGWNVMASYAWQDARLTATQSATALNGARLAQVPRHSAAVWNRVNLDAQWGAALGLVYRGEIFASTSNTARLPAFTRVDAAVYYALDKQWKLQANLENLFDKTYYASANSDNNITPGSPRALRVTLNAAF
ncbi:TonB-dependent siderophore receptor [Massilia sp. TS11]|uniref:TonB-dependent receptor n=1 Tax=Massilia sp. TS11 TaxID=2908003 RepID=UPI001EDA814B|nr:TonB-dependent siderophore receptor [Massilia sp. TS11]MCG2586725.1 TonB-dependent siderophore receptor [Massilia sp. TS11]